MTYNKSTEVTITGGKEDMMMDDEIRENEMPRASEGVIAYIPPELKKELEAIAAKEERSVSWILAKWIEEKVAEYKTATSSNGK